MLGGTVYSNMHVDSVFYGPRVEVDGHLIMEDGKFFTGPAPWESLDFPDYDAEHQGPFTAKGEHRIDEQKALFKTWKDVMGRVFHTRVGDGVASLACASVLSALKSGPAGVETLAKSCAMDRALARRAVAMLLRYELVQTGA
jgi:hypothetical protein